MKVRAFCGKGDESAKVCFADDILITKDGYENLTTAPKGIDEMRKIIDS